MSCSVIPNDKRYSKADDIKYDKPAKQVTIDFLEKLGFTNIGRNVCEENYKPGTKLEKIWDICGIHPETNESWRIDCEIKNKWGTVWKEHPFKYDTVSFPYRKRDKADEHATHHMVIGEDLKRFFLVKRAAVVQAPVLEKWITTRHQYEPFFNVSVNSPDGSFWFKDEKGNWNEYKG